LLYNICYKGKILLGPMSKENGDAKLLVLSKWFINLEIVPHAEKVAGVRKM
jgi:hypothetical protein